VTIVSLVLWLMSAAPDGGVTVSAVPCTSVADCWLDANGKPVARPRRFRGRRIPRGNCGSNLLWLRYRLMCEKDLCAAENVGDKC
jgi:hypothetical protein